MQQLTYYESAHAATFRLIRCVLITEPYRACCALAMSYLHISMLHTDRLTDRQTNTQTHRLTWWLQVNLHACQHDTTILALHTMHAQHRMI
jgi:hypothetical protein